MKRSLRRQGCDVTFPGVEHRWPAIGVDYSHVGVSFGDLIVSATHGSWAVTDTTTGDTDTWLPPETYTSLGGLVVASGQVLSVWGNSSTSHFYSLNLSTGAATSLAPDGLPAYSPIVATGGYAACGNKLLTISSGVVRTMSTSKATAAKAGTIWTLAGATLTAVDAATNTTTGTWTLPIAPGFGGSAMAGAWTTIGGLDMIVWPVQSTTTPAVWFRPSTGTSGVVTASPATGWPMDTGYEYIWEADPNGVVYGVAKDRQRLVALDILSGRWVADDPVTARVGRHVVVWHDGQLWIPSKDPNPWPPGWP